ncbi:MAG: hypothetical protein ACR2O4_06470 [Hyphomicrobiaceae bacterium]
MIDPKQIYNDMGPELRKELAHSNTPALTHLLQTIRADAIAEQLQMTVPSELSAETAIAFVLRYKLYRDQVRMTTELLQTMEQSLREYAQLGQGDPEDV